MQNQRTGVQTFPFSTLDSAVCIPHSAFINIPVLPNHAAQTSTDLIRLFHQSQLEWSRHLGEETALDFGRWISNPTPGHLEVANCLHDAFLLPGLTTAELMQRMEEISCKAGTPWQGCSISPSAPDAQRAELVEACTTAGWIYRPLKIFQRREIRPPIRASASGTTIIPTRASYRHFRQLLQGLSLNAVTRDTVSFGPLETADEELLHLDDSHVDSLLALQDGQPVGSISILTCGEVGTLRQWYIPDPDQNPQLAQLLLNRALEICTRAQLRQVMIGMQPVANALTEIAATSGFEPIGNWVHFTRPPV